MKHTTGEFAGQCFNLRAWQEKIVRQIYTQRDDGSRQYRTVFVGLPRKNGKTQLAAGLVLFSLFSEGEAEAEIYSAAGSREQAARVYKAATAMVRADPTLSRLATIRSSRKWMRYGRTEGTYQALSSDGALQHGLNPSNVICDELHAWKGLGGRELWDALTTGSDTRANPLTVVITTAGTDLGSICWDLWDYARKVRDGIIRDETFLPLLWEAPPECDWTDEDVWRATNPALGDFCRVEGMREQCARAQGIPNLVNSFKRLRLNIWTQAAEAWLDIEEWRRCGKPGIAADLAGRKCFAGVDLSATRDTTALALAFPLDEGRVALLVRFWIPEATAAERERRDRAPFLTWAAAGHCETTPGAVVDQDYIRRALDEIRQTYELAEVCFDPWESEKLRGELERDGFPVVKMRQGFASMSGPSKDLEKLIGRGLLVHDANEVMTWQVSNCIKASDSAGNIKPDKKRSSERIDGVTAAVMAVGRAVVPPDANSVSVYNSRGVLWV